MSLLAVRHYFDPFHACLESVGFEHFKFSQRNGEFSFILPRVISVPIFETWLKEHYICGFQPSDRDLGNGAAPKQNVIPEHAQSSSLACLHSTLLVEPPLSSPSQLSSPPHETKTSWVLYM